MISILVVDDQGLVREGIKILLEQAKEIQVVGEAKDGKEALQKTELLQPDIVLLDIEMPDISGLIVAKKIRTRFSKVKIIMLSTHEDSSYMEKATSCGAKGYLLKSVSSQELEWSIKLVSQGYSAIKSELLEKQQSLSKESESEGDIQPASVPSQITLPKKKVEDKLNKSANEVMPRSLSSVSTLPMAGNGSSDFGELESLLAHNHVGAQSIDLQGKRKKKGTQLLHGVNLIRLKRTVSSFEFKLLVFIILFSLGFLVFIALSS